MIERVEAASDRSRLCCDFTLTRYDPVRAMNGAVVAET